MSSSMPRPDPEDDPARQKAKPPVFSIGPKRPVGQKPKKLSPAMSQVLKRRLRGKSRPMPEDEETQSPSNGGRYSPSAGQKGSASLGPYPGPSRAVMPPGGRGQSTTGGRATMPTRRK